MRYRAAVWCAAKALHHTVSGPRIDLFRDQVKGKRPVLLCDYWALSFLPSLNVVLATPQEPPGAPLRSGSTFMTSSSPGFRVLLDMPSRTRALGLPPSRFQTVVPPSLPLTSNRTKV